MSNRISHNNQVKSIWFKLHIDLPLLLILIALSAFSLIIMWSASGQSEAMMKSKIIQIVIGFIVMLVMAQLPPRMYEKWSPYLYFICLILLIMVDVFGHTSKGAQRWLSLGFIRFQPSEIAKIVVPLMVARFINRDGCPPSIESIALSLLLIFAPAILVGLQPDLGTAVLIAISGLFLLFLAGIAWRLIIYAGLFIGIMIPVYWTFFIHDYQKKRILTFISPEHDPLGAGYHIIQSKIAIGSGGLFGKGWLQGTQSQLEFLPERHTDFIFSVIAEELGFIGICILLCLYIALISRGLYIASQAQTTFGRILTGGIMLVFFTYVFINIGMVSGILPVVGVPLPLISYGGTAFTVLMAGFGITMSIHTHRKLLSKNV